MQITLEKLASMAGENRLEVKFDTQTRFWSTRDMMALSPKWECHYSNFMGAIDLIINRQMERKLTRAEMNYWQAGTGELPAPEPGSVPEPTVAPSVPPDIDPDEESARSDAESIAASEKEDQNAF